MPQSAKTHLKHQTKSSLPKGQKEVLSFLPLSSKHFLSGGDAKMTLFTGSQRVADKLAVDLKGKAGGWSP